MRYLLWIAIGLSGCQTASDRVVLYSAQDQEFAEPLFATFTQQYRFTIAPKFDTEANKSVSLAAELLADARRPRADVHWNNEILNTIRLARAGVYQPYSSPHAAPFPDWTRPPSKLWQSFAARARVLIINTKLVPDAAERPKRLFDLTHAKWRGKIALAKPQFGTTATQAACLFEVLGAERAKQLYRELKANDVAIVAGNKQAAVRVANGDYAIGLTDTDDAMIELKAGKPVVLVYPDREPSTEFPRLGVLYIPNTLALLNGAPNAAAGRTLIDYLVQQESRLAVGGGYQIPLNPQVDAELPDAIVRPDRVARMAVDFEKAADLWDEVQAFLRDEFAR